MPGRPEDDTVTISDPFLVGLKYPINDHPPAQRALYLSRRAFVQMISGNSRLITPELGYSGESRFRTNLFELIKGECTLLQPLRDQPQSQRLI